jgi:hypothetical protein
MAQDGGLRKLFQQHIPAAHWQPIETWSTGQGVPDLNGCLDGIEFWIELKLTTAYAVSIRPHQIAWAERRLRAGGRVFLAVRRKADAGPRKGQAIDELWLFPGSAMRLVSSYGLLGNYASSLMQGGGPARWPWAAIESFLRSHTVPVI